VSKAAALGRKNAALGRHRSAKPEEVKKGQPLNDSRGQLMGLIEAVEPDGAVVYNGRSMVKVPIDAFGVNRKGLLLNLTKAQFDEMVASANPPHRS